MLAKDNKEHLPHKITLGQPELMRQIELARISPSTTGSRRFPYSLFRILYFPIPLSLSGFPVDRCLSLG